MKNILIFFPMFTGVRLLDINLFVQTFFVFVAFCLIASFVYIYNDSKDLAQDKLHPAKSLRPLASGVISVESARKLAMVLLLTGLTVGIMVSIKVLFVLLTYVFLNILYTEKLKYIGIVDAVIVALGFVLRLEAGSIPGNIMLSEWIVLLIFFGSLFLVFTKRYGELKFLPEKTKLVSYNRIFLNFAITLSATIIIIVYIMYVNAPKLVPYHHVEYLYTTVFFVVTGILRYIHLIFVEKSQNTPDKIFLSDKFLLCTVILWGLLLGGLIYL